MKTFLPTDTCPHTSAMLRHVFGTHEVLIPQGADLEPIRTEAATLALDWIWLLRYTVEPLPTLVIEGPEEQAGKTTFLKWLMRYLGSGGPAWQEDRERILDGRAQGSLNTCRLVVLEDVLWDDDMVEWLFNHTTRVDEHAQIACAHKYYTNGDRLGTERTWYVHPRALGHTHGDFRYRLEEETAAWCRFLEGYSVQSPKESRTWFNPALLRAQNVQG